MSENDGRPPLPRPGRDADTDDPVGRLVENVGYLLALHWASKRGQKSGREAGAAAALDDTAGSSTPPPGPPR